MNTKNDYTIQSVEKALKVLQVFNSDNYNDSKSLTLMEICEETGINASTAMRILYTLNKNGFVAFDSNTKQYSLDIALYRLGMSMYNSIDVHNVAQQHMKPLADETGLVVYLAKVDYVNDEIVVIDKVFPNTANTWPQMAARAGYILPLHSSGMSRLYLAEHTDDEIRAILAKKQLTKFTDKTLTDVEQILKVIAEIRKTGVAYSNCENEEYIGSICAPIKDYEGKMVAGISLGGIKNIIYGKNKDKNQKALLKVAKQISVDLGYR